MRKTAPIDWARKYEEIRDNLAQFKYIKVHCPGESMWARDLGNKVALLDNDPLDHNYRWHDFVQLGADNREMGTVLFRVFTKKFGFRWRVKENEAEEATIREALWNSIHALGNNYNCSFFCPGLGFVLARDEAVPTDIAALLADAGKGAIIDVVYISANKEDKIDTIYYNPDNNAEH